MVATFGRKNLRPTYKAAVVAPKLRKTKAKPKSYAVLYACIGGTIALLILLFAFRA